jgi:tetratricopeptide (TPR) repeat protein
MPEIGSPTEIAQGYYDSNDFERALEAFERALSIDAADPIALRGVAMSHHMLGNFDDAVYHYIAALAAEPRDATTQVNLGLVYHAQGRLEDAIERFRRAVALDKDDPFHWVALGRATYDAAEFDEAIRVMQRATELDPTNSEAFTYLGLAHEALGSPDEARANYERAIDLDVHDPFAHLHLASLLSEAEGNADQVVAHGRQALEEFESRGEREFQARAWSIIGWGLYLRREWDASAKASREALDLEPTFTIVREAYEEAVNQLSDVWDVDAGMKDLEDSLVEEPDLPNANEILGSLRARRDELRDKAAVTLPAAP